MRAWRTMAGVAVAAALAYAFPAAAQPLPGDTVRVEMQRLAWMDECTPPNSFVLDGQVALDSLRRYPQCAYLPARMDLSGRVRVGVDVFVDCNAITALAAHRSDSLRLLRVSLAVRSGGCRGMRSDYRWVEVPRPPAGYRVEVGDLVFSELDAGDDAAFDALLSAEGRSPWIVNLAGDFHSAPEGGAPIWFETVDMGGCRPVGSYVLDGPAALERLRRYPQCAHLPARMDFGERVLVGVSAFVDCRAHPQLEAWRVDAERRVLVSAHWVDGGCRAMRGYFQWVRIERPPPGYTIADAARRADAGSGLSIDARGEAEGDSVPVTHAPRGVSALAGCMPADGFVLDGPEALARLRGSRGCAEVPESIDLRDRVLVYVVLYGSCGGPGTLVTARRLDVQRVVRLTATWVDRVCRGASHATRWVAIPRPPAGYRVELERRRVERRSDRTSHEVRGAEGADAARALPSAVSSIARFLAARA